MAQVSVGLYVSTDHADLVQLSGTFQQPRIDTFSRTQLPKSGVWKELLQETGPETKPGSASEETLEQAEALLAQGIRGLLQRTRPNSPYVHTAIPPEAVVVRYFQMPWLPAKDRSAAVLFEATKYLPYRHEELNRDFLINHLIRMDKTTTSPMRIAFFAVKKALFTSYLRVLKEAGLVPVTFETVPLGLMRVLKQGKRLAPSESQVLIFVDRDTANITIGANETLYLSRNMAVPSPAGESGEPNFLEALINEARVSIDYYRRRFPGEPPTAKVALVGYQVDEKLAQAFSGALNLPVELLEPLKGIQGAEGAPPGMATPVGLALRGLDPSRGQLNLLPVEERPILQNLLKPAAAEAMAAVLLLGLLYGMSHRSTDSLEKKLVSLQQVIQSVPASETAKRTDLTQLTNLREEKANEVRFLESISKQRFDALVALARVGELLPREGWLSTALLEGKLVKQGEKALAPLSRETSLKLLGKVYLGEQAQEVEEINHLLDALRSNPSITASLPSVTLEIVKRARFYGLDLTEFQISCTSSVSGKKGETP